MYAETGIKSKTCRRYYKQFKEMGFFDWTTKKANGFPTVHFKLDMVKLTSLIKTFWVNRNGQNDQNDTVKMSESLTENTNKDISLSLDPNNQNTKKIVNNFDLSSDSSGSGNSYNSVFSTSIAAPPPDEAPVPLPGNFKPSAENLYWAVTSFPAKSPKLCIESFVDHFREHSRKNTSDGWQAQWRKWVAAEHEVRGYDEEKLLAEHGKIISVVRQYVYLFAVEVTPFLLHRDSFYSILCQEEHSFSRGTINECLEYLETHGFLTRYFGDYFYVSKTIEGRQLTDVTDFSRIYDEWNEIDNRLLQHIQDNKLVHRDDIGSNYPEEFQNSVDIYLKGSVQVEALFENEGHYFCRYSYEEDENERNSIETKFAELGINNSLVIESDYGDEFIDDYTEDAEDYPDCLSDYLAAMKASQENRSRESVSV
jgi:hypothetical protein